MPYLAKLSRTVADLEKHFRPVRGGPASAKLVGVGFGCQPVPASRRPNARLEGMRGAGPAVAIAVRMYSVRICQASHNSEAGRVTVRFEGVSVFFLIKVLLLPIWLPFKILLEIAEHSGRRRHYRSRGRSAPVRRALLPTSLMRYA
jgi:hypothetical protein